MLKFWLLIFVSCVLISCSESGLQKEKSDTVKNDSAPAMNSEETVIKCVREFLQEKGIEGGQGEFHFRLEGIFPEQNRFIVAFTDSNDYFENPFSGILLMDEHCKIYDFQIYSADSLLFDEQTINHFKAGRVKFHFQVDYEVIYKNKAGKYYLDSIENRYWIDHAELARPNESRYSILDVPEKYLDTMQMQYSYRIVGDKFGW